MPDSTRMTALSGCLLRKEVNMSRWDSMEVDCKVNRDVG